MATMDDEIDRLEGLSTFELRILWRRQWRQPPPMRLSKDMLIRGVAWKLQEAALGGIGKLESRRLAALVKAESDTRAIDKNSEPNSTGSTIEKNTTVTAPTATTLILREGNRLVREWNGTTHTVLVLASGFEWQGNQYRSLSQIAEAITGAHWSGPRFFGLIKRKAECKKVMVNAGVDRQTDQKSFASGRSDR